MEEQYNFDINLDFLDSSTTPSSQQNGTIATADNKQTHLIYDIESLAARIASVNDFVVQQKNCEDKCMKLQKQLQDLSDSAMSIRCMYEREKTEKAKYVLLSKELEEKCNHIESQLTNKTLHLEQLTSKVEQSNEKGPIAYNELALRYQRLALQLEDDKQLNYKERMLLQQVQEYIEAKKLTPLHAFKKKAQVVHPKKKCNLKVETRTQGTSMEGNYVEPLKETISQGTQYTSDITTTDTNTPSTLESLNKEVRIQVTRYISSTTTRGTCTSVIKTHNIGTNFPEVVPVSVDDILTEMICDVEPLSPIPDIPPAVKRQQERLSENKVEMKSMSTNTALRNVRKPIDYVPPSIKHSDSRPPSRNIFDRVKNESPFLTMPTMNPFAGISMNPSALHNTAAELWHVLGQTIFALVQNSNVPTLPMHTNMTTNLSGEMARRQRSRDERGNSGKDFFDEESRDYMPATRNTATSPISPQDYGVLEGSKFFDGNYMEHVSAFVPVAKSEDKANASSHWTVLNKSAEEENSEMETRLGKSSRVDEILKLFPEQSHSLQTRKAIRKLLRTSKKGRKLTDNNVHTQVGSSLSKERTEVEVLKSFQKIEADTNWNKELFVPSSEESIYSNDSIMTYHSRAEDDSFKGPRPPSVEGFLGFEDERYSQTSDEVFCKPYLPPIRRQAPVVTSPLQQISRRQDQRSEREGETHTVLDVKGNLNLFPQNVGKEDQHDSTPISYPFNPNEKKEHQQSQVGRETDKHSWSSTKKANRKRRITSDTKESSKIKKMDDKNNISVGISDSFSVQKALSLARTAAEEKKSPSTDRSALPTREKLPNSPFCGKNNSNSTPRKYKPSKSTLWQKKMPKSNGTAKAEELSAKLPPPDFSEIPLSNENKTDWDINETQEKSRVLLSLACNETNSDSSENQVPLNSCNPLARPGKEKPLNSVPHYQMTSNFDETLQKLSSAGVNSELSLINEEISDWAIKERQGSPTKRNFTPSTPDETDWNFEERKENLINTRTLNYDPKAPQRELFNDVAAPKDVEPLKSELHAQRASNFNETIGEIEDEPSTLDSRGPRIVNCYKLSEPTQVQPIKSIFQETETAPEKQNSPTHIVHDQSISNSAPKHRKNMDCLFQGKETEKGQKDLHVLIVHDERIPNSAELSAPKQEVESRCMLQGQEVTPGQGNLSDFIPTDQRTLYLGGLPAPKQEKPSIFVLQGQKTGLGISTIHDEKMPNSTQLPEANTVSHSQGASSELSESNEQRSYNPNEFQAAKEDHLPNPPSYNEKTTNFNELIGTNEKKAVLEEQKIFDGLLPSHQDQRRLQERKPSTKERPTSGVVVVPRNKCPSTSNMSKSKSSGSDTDLIIDCPQSPTPYDSSILDLSLLVKTPEKIERTPPQFKTPDSCNRNTSVSDFLTSSTENLAEEFFSNGRPDKSKFQKFLNQIMDEVAIPLSPISVMASTEKTTFSETESDEEASKPQTSGKWKRKLPLTSATAVKRSARLKAKSISSTLSLSHIPGVQLGKYTKKRSEEKTLLQKLSEVEDHKEEKVDNKVSILYNIPLGFFKDSMEDETQSMSLAIDEIPEETQQSMEVSFSFQLPLPLLAKDKSIFNQKSKELTTIPTQEASSILMQHNMFQNPQTDQTTPFMDKSVDKMSDEKPKLVLEDSSTQLISCNECPASPPPIEQIPEKTHITREVVQSIPVVTKAASNSLLSRIIANYNAKQRTILTESRQIDKKLLAQLKSIINDFISGLGLVMDCIRTADTLLNLTTSEIFIAQALIGIVKTAPRPETEVPARAPQLNLSETHCKLVCLLVPLYMRLPNLRKHIAASIEQSLFTFTRGTTPLEESMNLTQFYLDIIADPKATTNPARLFICKCLYFYNLKATPMIYETLCVYPSVLPKRDDPTYDRSDALINTIQCLLMSTFYNKEKTDLKTREMLTKLRKYYNYENFKPTQDEVINNLIAKVRAGRFKNVSYAFVLICKRMDQKNAEKLVLADRLLPLANEYYQTLSQTTENDDKIACVLECVSFIIKPFDLSTEISVYINLFVRFLNAVDRQTIQEAAVAALLRTIRFGYVHCFNAIYNFKPNYELTTDTKNMLKSFVYKKNLGFLKKLEHQVQMLVTT